MRRGKCSKEENEVREKVRKHTSGKCKKKRGSTRGKDRKVKGRMRTKVREYHMSAMITRETRHVMKENKMFQERNGREE